ELGKAQAASGNPGAARSAFDRALKLAPENAAAAEMLAKLPAG
ncbi:MAG: tetratricopeptide repeat protein, partial [Actinomycetota bacterium]